YRKMAGITNEAGLKDLEEELKDRFGSPPPLIKRLLSLIALRLEAARRGLTYLGLKDNQLIAKFRNKETMTLPLRPEEKENLIQTLKNFLPTIKHP
ncbi:hypothetical protein LR003_00795, partial [candidate division NPL-UPA2 bacterium]|nr:hypothetical protein [candidate division NPL-UPA2 bacterium]